MPTIRKGATTGTRPPKSGPAEDDISGLVQTSVDDCSSAVFHASRAQLIAAHRWCEANPGNKSRRTIIARALRKRQLADDTEALMAAATAAATAAIRGERA